MSDEVLVVGHTWVDGGPVLRLEGGTWPLEGQVSFVVLAGRHCIGHGTPSGRAPCSEQATLATGTQCSTCQSRDAFRVCVICDGHRCPRLSGPVEAFCRRERVLYLACFGAERLKVGTAVIRRQSQRIVEQGPLAASRVARGDGRAIKQLETALSRQGFTESMSRSRKLALLDGSMEATEAEARVAAAAAELPDLVPAELRVLLHEPEVVAMPELAVAARSFRVNPLPLQDGRLVEGRVVGAVGHVVFLEDDAGRFAVDLGALRGRRIDREPGGCQKRPTVQLGLFG